MQWDRLPSCSKLVQETRARYADAPMTEHVALEESWCERALLQSMIPSPDSRGTNTKARFQTAFYNRRETPDDYSYIERAENFLIYEVLCVRPAQGHTMPIVDPDRVAVKVNEQIERALPGLFHVTSLENLG